MQQCPAILTGFFRELSQEFLQKSFHCFSLAVKKTLLNTSTKSKIAVLALSCINTLAGSTGTWDNFFYRINTNRKTRSQRTVKLLS